MEEQEIYRQAMQIARQLCDIMEEHELEDLTALKEWLENNEVAAEVIRHLMNDKVLLQYVHSYRRKEKSEEVQRLAARIRRYQWRRRRIGITAAAAMLVLALGVGMGRRSIFRTGSHTANTETFETLVSSTEPTLILRDGKQVRLGDKESLAYISSSGIAYQDRQILKYNRQDKGVIDTLETSWNRLVIPRQCNYQVVLADGSVVHMNAESQLEYPIRFTGNERRVVLKGEAYFEVNKDDRPFIVEIGQVNIRVYGTKFNVNAYRKDYLEAVLIEGKVGLSFSTDTDREQILAPSQLCSVDLRSFDFEVQQVEVGKYIAWISGFLRYDNDTLESLLEDLKRWYDVDFSYSTPDLKEIKISASIDKDLSLEEVLALVQTTIQIKINRTERRYTIYR